MTNEADYPLQSRPPCGSPCHYVTCPPLVPLYSEVNCLVLQYTVWCHYVTAQALITSLDLLRLFAISATVFPQNLAPHSVLHCTARHCLVGSENLDQNCYLITLRFIAILCCVESRGLLDQSDMNEPIGPKKHFHSIVNITNINNINYQECRW